MFCGPWISGTERRTNETFAPAWEAGNCPGNGSAISPRYRKPGAMTPGYPFVVSIVSIAAIVRQVLSGDSAHFARVERFALAIRIDRSIVFRPECTVAIEPAGVVPAPSSAGASS